MATPNPDPFEFSTHLGATNTVKSKGEDDTFRHPCALRFFVPTATYAEMQHYSERIQKTKPGFFLQQGPLPWSVSELVFAELQQSGIKKYLLASGPEGRTVGPAVVEWVRQFRERVFEKNTTQSMIQGTLYEDVWLDSILVDKYFSLIQKRSMRRLYTQCRDVICMETSMFTSRNRSDWVKNIQAFAETQKEKRLCCDLLLVPINVHNNHYVVLALQVIRTNFGITLDVEVYDSWNRGKDGHTVYEPTDVVTPYTVYNAFLEFNSEHNYWQYMQLKHLDDRPIQNDEIHCGIFACMYAEAKSRNARLTFSQEDMSVCRTQLCLDIIKGELSENYFIMTEKDDQTNEFKFVEV